MSMHPGLRVWGVVVVATLLALTIVLLASTPAATALAGACRVTNERSGIATATLQAAVSAARSGDRLRLARRTTIPTCSRMGRTTAPPSTSIDAA